jgi:WD40 repeat protein/serine/threonine protein kinase
MESEREQKSKGLFKSALELPPEERGAFLDRACAGDEELRFAVDRLLAAAESPGISIGTSAMKLAARELAEERKQEELRQQLTAGTLINRYRIIKPVGAGGMGTVYLAEDTELHRQVAIKALTEDFAANADRVRRFEREALTVSALKHPNILTIHEMLSHEDLRLIVTEFVEGETLRQVISRSATEQRDIASGAMDWREVVNIAAQVAAALNAAHAANIFHRDIKPENVIRQTDGHVKVLDFGVAKHAGQEEANNGAMATTSSNQTGHIEQAGIEQTRTGQAFCTPGYASPEQMRGDPKLKPDKRTDIFSLGVVMFEMLAGRRPFARATMPEEIAAVLAPDDAPDVREFCADVPAALSVIIAKAVSKDRERRYASAGEMLAELQELKSQIEATDLARTQQSLKTQNANRLLSQFTALYLKDRRVRLPLGKLATVWLAANLPRGKPEKALLRKSVISILLKFGRRALLLAMGLALFAYLSIGQQWEARTVRDGHTKAVRRAAFSPDGKLLVTGSDDGLVIVWDFAGRRRLATIDDHKAGVFAVAFSPNGRHFATGADNASIIVWEIAAQSEKQIENIRLQKVAKLHGQNGSVAALVFSPDGERLISVSHDQGTNDIHVGGQTVIWDTKRWRKLRELPIGNVYGALPLFLDDQRLLVCGEIWDVDSGKVVEDTRINEWDGWAALSPDGKFGVRLDNCCYVEFWQFSPLKQLRRHLAHQFINRAAAISHDGRWAASGAENIVFWDMRALEPITSHKHNDNVWDLAFSPDDHWLVSTHGDGSVLVWDANERRLVTDFAGHSGNINSVDFSPDGKRFVTAGDDRSIIIWNAATGLKEGALNGHEIAVKTVKFLDSNRLASVDRLGNLFFWDIAQRSYKDGCPQAGRCGDGLISPDGHWLVRLWQVIDLRQNRQALDFESAIGGRLTPGAAFSADGRWLAAIQSGTRRLLLWDTATWQVVAHTQIQGMEVIRMAFSPDGGKLALGGHQGEVALMNVHPLGSVAMLGRHLNHVQAVTFSPDGKLIAAASDDATVGIWDVEKSGFAARLVHNAPVLSVAFSPDGKQLVTAGQDETVRLYSPYRALWGWRLD